MISVQHCSEVYLLSSNYHTEIKEIAVQDAYSRRPRDGRHWVWPYEYANSARAGELHTQLTTASGRTWSGSVTPQDQAFAALNAALETRANFWNGGQIYGTPNCNSLHLLLDYFTQYPEAPKEVVLSIKAGLTSQRIPDGSEAFVRKCVEDCNTILPRHFPVCKSGSEYAN